MGDEELPAEVRRARDVATVVALLVGLVLVYLGMAAARDWVGEQTGGWVGASAPRAALLGLGIAVALMVPVLVVVRFVPDVAWLPVLVLVVVTAGLATPGGRGPIPPEWWRFLHRTHYAQWWAVGWIVLLGSVASWWWLRAEDRRARGGRPKPAARHVRG